ncbi:MAG: M3 family metallopeptidase [Actinomycetales bacterium]|nr:M3 family metallopeptidase [Actinomycetales bacterium]
MTFNAEEFELTNPFAKVSELPYELPDFTRIRDEHYLPAFYAGCAEQLAEVDAILEAGEPTFENTIVALERSGRTLSRMLNVFYNKSSADTSKVIDDIEAEIAPKLAAHTDAIRLNGDLFARIEALHAKKDVLGLDDESAWLVERYYRDFVHAGAKLSIETREELKKYNEKLSELEAKFGTNILADQNDLAVHVTDLAELAGLSDNEIAAAKASAEARGLDGWLIDMVNYTGNPALASLTNRELREKIMRNTLIKGARDNANDNRPVLLEIVRLRAERAVLLGHPNHASYVLEEQTAGNTANVHAMLRKIAPAAIRNARAEASDIQAAIDAEAQTSGGDSFEVASWDWDLYTERVRQAKYNIDTSLFKPYFELERVLWDGVFWAASRLFGIRFVERKDLVAYHPEARVFEVFNEDGSQLALFIGDFFTRDSKRGGAWMNNLVDQSTLLGQKPVVVNNLNIPKPPAGEPALLTFDETSTLFHEFGHALHGMFSNVTYPRFSGTWVHRDFVEFPSQVNEMWMLWPEVLANYAKHYQTGESLPQEWVDNLKRAETFNQGQETTAYLAASVLDLAWHELSAEAQVDSVEEFEARAIADYGLAYSPTPTRYRSTYFSHIFAGGYSAGYYGYIWSEVLDADSVEWFKNNGGLKRENGERFRRELLSRGGSVDSMQLFRNFRGQDASIEPLLKRRGLN